MALFKRGNSLGLNTTEKKDDKKDDTLPFVTPTQLNDFGASIRNDLNSVINGAVAEIRGAFSTLQQPRTEPSRQPDIRDITDEEYQAALQAGDITLIKVREQANLERVRREGQSALSQARGELTPVLEGMSNELASTILSSLEYYPLFKKDVDTLLATIPAAQRNRAVIEHIYQSVCGRPENLIKRDEYRAQKAQQQSTEDAMASSTPARRGGQQQEQAISFENTFGENISSPTATLHGNGPLWQGRRRGYDPENYSKDMGFAGKDDFARFTHAVMRVEDCPECYTPIIGGKCAPYCQMNKMRGAA